MLYLRTSFFQCLRLRGRKQPRKRATSSIYIRQGWVRTTPIIAIWSQPYLQISIAFRLKANSSRASARNKTVRWSPSMIHDEPAALTSEEFDSLVEVGEGGPARHSAGTLGASGCVGLCIKAPRSSRTHGIRQASPRSGQRSSILNSPTGAPCAKSQLFAPTRVRGASWSIYKYKLYGPELLGVL